MIGRAGFLGLLWVSASLAQYAPPGGGGGGFSGQFSTASAAYVAGTYFLAPGGGLAANATEAAVQGAAGGPGTVANLSVRMPTSPGSGVTVAFTWRKNGADQAVTCSIAGTSAKTCADNTNSFSFVATDLLSVKVVVSGGTATSALILSWGGTLAGGGGGGGGLTLSGLTNTQLASLTNGQLAALSN